MENEEVIRHQMEETRTSLTEKLETLEDKLISTVQETTSAVNETVATVKETVHEGVEAVHETVANVKESIQEGAEAVKETVTDWFDIKSHVEQHPWFMLGGSVVAGFVLGNVIGNMSGRRGTSASFMGHQMAPGAPSSLSSFASGSSAAPSTSSGNGWHRDQNQNQHKEEKPSAMKSTMSSLFSMLEPEIAKLKGLALGAALGTIREMVTKEIPPAMGQQVTEMIDNATRKLGGEPIPSSDFANCPLTSHKEEENEGESGHDGHRQREGALDPVI